MGESNFKPTIYDYEIEELTSFVVSKGLKKYVAKQIFDWVYQKNITNFELMTNLNLETRTKLKQLIDENVLSIYTQQNAADGTVKFLCTLRDGLKIETVLMRQSYGNSVCVTTQVGCNMGCKFCASGLLKKSRNLTAGEIVAQVALVDNYLRKEDQRVSHIVVMGIGEPFDNFDNLIKFLKIINDPNGYQIGARHITVSTCGIVPKIKQFADLQLQVNLAISLHAPTDEIRSQIMPINRAYPLNSLLEAINYYLEKTNRRITFEYVMLNGVNDTVDCALGLVKLMRGLNAYVNLIPYNTVKENQFQRSTNVDQFYQILQSRHINCIVRKEFGLDIDAACGQLRAKIESNQQ